MWKTNQGENSMFKKISKFLDSIMSIEFLAKWLLACGIGANILIVALVITKIIIAIASL